MSFIQGKEIHRPVSRALLAAEHNSWGCLGESQLYRALEEAMWKQDMIDEGLLVKLAGPVS